MIGFIYNGAIENERPNTARMQTLEPRLIQKQFRLWKNQDAIA